MKISKKIELVTKYDSLLLFINKIKNCIDGQCISFFLGHYTYYHNNRRTTINRILIRRSNEKWIFHLNDLTINGERPIRMY